MKHWKQFKKEITAAICGAFLHHTWMARNWKKCTEQAIQIEEAVRQIKMEII